MIPEKKVCKECNEEKELTEFYKHKGGKYGFGSKCKVCSIGQTKKYYQENKEKLKAYNKKYREENSEEIKARERKHYLKNAERNRVISKKYRQDNPEKVKAANKKWRQENKEKIAARVKKYYKENKDQFIQRNHRRKARIKENGYEHFTTKQLNEHWIQEGIDPESCYYCEDGKYEHLDHYVPIAKGGPHFMSNLRPSCECCNLSKSDKDPEEWMASRL